MSRVFIGVRAVWFAMVVPTCLVLACLVLTCLGPTARALAQAVTLAEQGHTDFQIVLPGDATAVDRYAVDKLAGYLHQSTGATFALVTADALPAGQRAIFVGLGAAARQRLGQSLDPMAALGEQRHRTLTHDGDLYLFGEGVHGQLSAVMHFLERHIGFRWYTVFDPPVVPSHPTLKVGPLDEEAGFSFVSRDVALRWDFDFYQQNLINMGYYRSRKASVKQADSPYVSWLPTTNFVHTAFSYIPPTPRDSYADRFAWQEKRNYFETNPEFFSMDSRGKRVPDKQLCYANPQLRAELTRQVLRDIELNTERIIITMDAADNPGPFCLCPDCVALETKYQSPGGPLYDYVLELCDQLRQSHPQTMVRLLAYRRSQTQKPPTLPAGQMLPENLIVSFAPIDDAYFADWTHPDPAIQETFSHLKQWGAISHHLWAWIYPNPWGSGDLMPLGNVGRLITNIRLMHQVGVRGLFADHAGYLTRSGWSDLQLYLMFKLMQDIDCDTDAIITEFTDNQYGQAAPLVRTYLAELEAARKAMHVLPPVRFNSSLYNDATFPYLTVDNLTRWHGYFVEMQKKTQGSPHHADNVRLLQRELDFALLERWFPLQERHPETFNDYKQVMARIRSANNLKARQGMTGRKLGERHLGDLELRLATGGQEKPLPAELADIDPSRIRTFLPTTTRNRTQPKIDPEAPFGYAIPVHQPETPFRFGYCQWRSRTPNVTDRKPEMTINRDQISPGRYKLYRLGVVQIDVHDAILWFGRSWATTLQLGQRLHVPGEENRWETYVSLKFDGPSYGGQAPEDEVLVGRIILVSLDDPQKQAAIDH